MTDKISRLEIQEDVKGYVLILDGKEIHYVEAYSLKKSSEEPIGVAELELKLLVKYPCPRTPFVARSCVVPSGIGGNRAMKKLFISQPMRGKSDAEIKEERTKAILSAEKIIGEQVEVLDSFFENAPADAKPLWFLGKSLELLAGADVAYFVPGWNEARGCVIEHACAVEYGIDRIEP